MRRAFVLFGVVWGSLITTMPAWAQFGGGGGFGPPVAPKPADDPRPIQLEITILDIAAAQKVGKQLSEEEQIARLEQLEAESKATGVHRYKLNLVSNEPGEFQQGETVQMTVGRNVRGAAPNDPAGRGGGFGVAMGDVTRAQQVGTMIRATARPVATGAVMELVVERSGTTNPRPAVDGNAPQEYPKVSQLTLKTTLVLKEGRKTIIASGITTNADRPNDETWVLARVVVGPAEKNDTAMIKIFHLQNVEANATATMISKLFNRGDVRAIPDTRTNTIIVASAPEDVLQQIEAILMKLDEPASAAVAPQVRKVVPVSDPLFETLPNIRKRTPVRDASEDLSPATPAPAAR
jgi:hypothetical protein